MIFDTLPVGRLFPELLHVRVGWRSSDIAGVDFVALLKNFAGFDVPKDNSAIPKLEPIVTSSHISCP